MSSEHPPTIRVTIEPVGRRTEIPVGSTILDAARLAGVELVAVCGGIGVCDTCRVQVLEGATSPPSIDELAALEEEELRAGYRLACQATLSSDARISVPPESLASLQRLQIEGEMPALELDPPFSVVDVRIDLPSMDDLRPDASRISDALAGRGYPLPDTGLPVLRQLSFRLRENEGSVRLAIAHRPGGAELATVLAPGRAVCGLAFDVGTTKLAGYLADLATGHVLARAGAVNPQIAFGEDVVSRIASANGDEVNRQLLHTRLGESLDDLAGWLCAEAGIERDQVAGAVAVGNTVMHHFVADLPVRPLGEAPYLPVIRDPLPLSAAEVGLQLAPGARVYLAPLVAGYVGADHVAMLTAAGLWEAESPILALDIGTNTEISVARDGRLWSCSCASGPAFEGAHIHDGMRAAPGAIERVLFVGDDFRIHTIGDRPPVGICGSGILDAVAALHTAGLLDERGSLRPAGPRIRRNGRQLEFVLVPAGATGHGKDIVVTRSDVHEIQLAKGAIRAGIEILLEEAQLRAENLEAFHVAGALGSYLDLRSACRIGMFPDLPPERFRQIGNAAGAGALQMLLSASRRRAAEEGAKRIRYVELTIHPRFHDVFMQTIFL